MSIEQTKSALVKLHQQVRNSQVRIMVSNAGGSGTIVYSKPAKDGTVSTYVLTCHHVVEGAISHRKEWDSKLQKDRKKEYRQIAKVEFFDYDKTPHGRRPVNYSLDGDIVTYDKDHDMALIKLRMKTPAPFIAKILERDRIEELTSGSKVFAVGAAMLHDPIITEGIITHMGDEIDFKLYWMSNAQIIFGNSGGAIFYQDPTGEYSFIGIPSRVAVAGWGSAVTHLGYFSPITRVYEFLEEQLFDFILPGSTKTEEECDKERQRLRDEAARKTDDEGGGSPVGAVVDSRG